MAVKIHLPTESENARIEMLPLIDVVFCILTFFYFGGGEPDAAAGHYIEFAPSQHQSSTVTKDAGGEH